MCIIKKDPVHDTESTSSRMDTIPNGHTPEWTQSRMDAIPSDTIPNGHNPEWTRSRMSTYNSIVTLVFYSYCFIVLLRRTSMLVTAQTNEDIGRNNLKTIFGT